MARVAWSLRDVYTDETYEFEINPKRPGLGPAVTARTYTAEDVIDGVAIVVEGPSEPVSIQLEGYCLTEAQLVDLDAWAAKGYRAEFTTHIDQQFQAIITDFTPLRKRKTSRDAYHEWSMTILMTPEH